MPLQVERVDVGAGRLHAIVRCTDLARMRTSACPGLAERALDLLPGLARHSCECGSSHGFVAELRDTETPHLLEHVAFELMALSGSPRTLHGRTTWDFASDGPGTFHVYLDFDDDLVALAALREGVAVVEWLSDEAAEAPAIDAIEERLRALRRRDTQGRIRG